MDHPNIKVKKTRNRGRGVFATHDIRKGTVVASYDGAIYDNDFDGWTDDLLNHTIQFAPSKWRDSQGVARYMNHSCNPNCGVKDLFKIVAMRTIKAGEEITWDYEMTEKSSWWRLRCKCGATNCRKTIGNYTKMPKSVREKYKGFISEWLTKKPRKKK